MSSGTRNPPSSTVRPSASDTAVQPAAAAPDRGSWRSEVAAVIREPAIVATGAMVAFIAISIWWLTVDRQVPIYDPGMHLLFAFNDYDALRAGHPLTPFTVWTLYPPLTDIVGAIASLIGGLSVAGPVVAQNLIFIPLLSLACFRIGRMTFGAPAGACAVLFALGTPMIAGQFHQFLLDGPETAMVAATVWLLLESRGLRRTWVAAAAGIVCGLGFLTKESFPAFVAGVFLVVLARGGWRRWRGLAAFLALTAGVALPWYIYHRVQLSGLAHTAAAGGYSTAPASYRPPRLSAQNAAWYLWSDLNYQLLAPLMLFAAIGVVSTVVEIVRGRLRDLPAPELLVGGLVAYLGVTYQLPHGPRYSLPGLVFLAVLGTGWIFRLRPRGARLLAGGLLVVVVIANTLGASFGVGGFVRLTLPGAPRAPGSVQGRLILSMPNGFTVGAPQAAGNLVSILRPERRLGFTSVEWDPGALSEAFSAQGLFALARIADLAVIEVPFTALGPHDLFILHEPVTPGAVPCARLSDGTGVWLTAGSPLAHPAVLVCPTHHSSFAPA